ncbi:MAG: LacI family DNA-binding transcriptional regulator [Bifidobacteriaceae bacterium]|jgi:LacI family xylobiose transport system transcriptional regulator|nr:LacI family DNA-binding transcriptional regulator [Bifidobacteriaceae bacterium]
MPRPYRTRDRRATLETIARDAKVSVSTVSKVLNGRAGVSSATRRLVEERLEKHGYRRRSAPARSKVIELVFFELGTEWILEVLQGVEDVANELGCGIMLTQTDNLLRPRGGWVETVVQRRPMGVILLFSSVSATEMRQLSTHSIPFVIVDPAAEPRPGVPYVRAQNWAGALGATQHLLELGHRNIAMTTGPTEQLCSHARVAGFRSAFELAGLPYRPEMIRWGRFHPEDGRALALELLSVPDRPTAIFAGADLQAVGVYQAVGQLGLRIPQDLSVVGFDDLPIARLTWPPLTTVRQPIREMGQTAARIITESIDPQRQRLELATELVIRSSTAPAANSDAAHRPA